MFPVVKVMTLVPTELVTRPVVKVALVARWISKPLSLFALSVQVRVTLSLLPCRAAVAATLEGAAGAITGTLAVFE